MGGMLKIKPILQIQGEN
ncbi:MAG: hypothetical protein ACLR43_10530 [Faecalibacillus faecis]